MGSVGHVCVDCRQFWNKNDERIKKVREINLAVVHCTATNPSWYADKSAEDVVKEIRRWHVQERKWSDIGYHTVIHRNGDVVDGRPIERSGAHTRGLNKHSVGIALVGGRGGCSEGLCLRGDPEL